MVPSYMETPVRDSNAGFVIPSPVRTCHFQVLPRHHACSSGGFPPVFGVQSSHSRPRRYINCCIEGKQQASKIDDGARGREDTQSSAKSRSRALDARVVLRAAQARAENAQRLLDDMREVATTSPRLYPQSDSLKPARSALPGDPCTTSQLQELLTGLRTDERTLRKADLRTIDSAHEILDRLVSLKNAYKSLVAERTVAEERLQRKSTTTQQSQPLDSVSTSDASGDFSGSAQPSRVQRNMDVSYFDGTEIADGPSQRLDGDNEWTNPDSNSSTRMPGSSDDQGQARSQLPGIDVARMKETFFESGSTLLQRASNVGAGLEGTFASLLREDGTVDIDKVRANVRGGFDRFGETWQRLNGRDPVSLHSYSSGPVTDTKSTAIKSMRDDSKIAELRLKIGQLEKTLSEASKDRESVLRREDQLGKLIRAREIRAMDDKVSAIRRTLAVEVLQLEVENIYSSLSEEIERSGFEMMDQRVMIAEFGDIDERLASLAVFIDQDEPLLIDDDEVGVLANDIQDLKLRLGLDMQVYSSRLDAAQVRQALTASVVKARIGFEFYIRGLRLFGGDCLYAFRLFRRVIVGYTLTPREVRTLRRTGRDLLTLIPFTIILIAPLTPVGHVLIFSFLQRYWPDFFPSTFSERRQALMKRHEEYAKGIRQESLENGLHESDARPNSKNRDKSLQSGIFARLRFFGGDDIPAVEDKEHIDEVVKKSRIVVDEKNLEAGDDGFARIGLNNLADNSVAGQRSDARRRQRAIALDDVHLAD